MTSDFARWSLHDPVKRRGYAVERVLSGLAAEECLLDRCASAACVRARK